MVWRRGRRNASARKTVTHANAIVALARKVAVAHPCGSPECEDFRRQFVALVIAGEAPHQHMLSSSDQPEEKR